MKCEVIMDLLPAYIDNTCSPESKLLVEEHLHDCAQCSKLFKDATENVEVKSYDDSDTYANLQEKDLLLNAKKNIRFETIKKIFKVIYTVIIGLNILGIIVGYLSIKIGYDLEYPRFYFGSLGLKTYSILFIMFMLPLLCSILGKIILSKTNYIKSYGWKIILNVLALLISIMLSLASGFMLVFVTPPLESYTNSPKNYLHVANDMRKYEAIYKNFFPEKVPDDAENIEYSYRKYNGLFETTSKISASWSLPEKSYEYYKQIIEKNSTMNEIEANKYEIYLPGYTYPPNLKLNFEFNDEKKELKYTAIIEKK
ncbi:zf-HC2 domain-containing protein [Clostridium beijerinckii]|uniref:Anti-sigma-YlaC factor YlaD n=1 Tax=Clostridium beijerinckii TaxID=1520 RepID=A0AAE5LPL5_CLOBE|nr:zf-HC2 domain-containing protein [Clostridium beijerinckii]NSB13562.1 putative anti-sigma-YlaC factor YlaD [Clostridium beijerinckii]OOM19223.1 hypothetical protein CLOBE_54290 [Clostridium beijerinckii]